MKKERVLGSMRPWSSTGSGHRFYQLADVDEGKILKLKSLSTGQNPSWSN